MVTKAILAIIGAVFVLDAIGGAQRIGFGGSAGGLARDFAVRALELDQGQWYRLLTAGFLHYGIIHILFNGWAIWNLGQALESSLGKWRYAGLFLVSVLMGSAGSVLLSPNALAAGASGGAFGLMAAGFMGSRARGVPFGASGWGPTLAMNFVITFTIPGISLGGHLGGAIAGAIAGHFFLGRRAMVTPKDQRDRQDAALLIGLAVLAVIVAFVGVAMWKSTV